jgi:DNA modification methylase
MSEVFTTRHRALFADASDLPEVPADSVDLVVTSPPYPMVEMWDSQFAAQDESVADALARQDGEACFEAMHGLLDRAWRGLERALRPGALACINVGDATRSIGGSFRLFPNHSRIVQSFTALGFQCLPQIVWRKPANSPTKFVGSGMLPAGAYVTLEHEWVLVFRKGGLRRFPDAAARRRRRDSAYFWEERNCWFSDLWDIKGTRQRMETSSSGPVRHGRSAEGPTRSADGMPAARARSGSFPYELAERLILMYSLYGDLVVDPFLGTGTTLLAAMACGRNCLGVEIDPTLGGLIGERTATLVRDSRRRAELRLTAHLDFVASLGERGREPAHRSARYGFPVVTGQERDIRLLVPVAVRARDPWEWEVEYADGGSSQPQCVEQELPFELEGEGNGPRSAQEE